jgi:hypothetical protein
MGLSERVIEAGAFFKLKFIEGFFIGKGLCGSATFGAHGIDLAGQTRCASDW